MIGVNFPPSTIEKDVKLLKTEWKDPKLFQQIKEFITVYLPIVKKRSCHTVAAYRDAINLYLDFISAKRNVSMKELTSADFCQENVVSFMDWLSKERGNEVTSVNQRLSHIKGFCAYLQKNDVLSFMEKEDISDISELKDTRNPEFIWLNIEQVKLLLDQPDIRKKTGIRDRFFLALIYESGCRLDEMLHLHVKNFILNGKGQANLDIFGKGNKHRRTPLSADIIPLFQDYCKIFHPDFAKAQDEFLFYTDRNGLRAPMSVYNVRRFMKTYEEKAIATGTKLPHIHPHLWRRTRAMHLYMAGVPLPLVAEWLGHADITTTLIYARATDEMKRDAQRKLENVQDPVFQGDVAFDYANDEDAMKRLCGLK